MSEKKSLARRYAEFVMALRWPIILVTFAVSGYFATHIKDLDMRNDPDTLLPPSNKYVATNLYAEHNYGMGNIMVAGFRIKDGDIYQPWFINMVQEVHRKLVDLPESREVNFISLAAQKVKYMGADENGLVFKRLIPTEGISDDPATAKEQLAFLKEGMETNPVMAPMLLYMEDASGNRCAPNEYEGCTAKGIFVIGDYTDEVKPIYLSWVTELVDIIDSYRGDDRYEVLVAGEPYFLAYMLYDLARKWWLFGISLIIVLVVLWLEFRNWRGALFPLLGVGCTISLTLGLMGMTQFKLTTMMVLTPMLLLAIGIGHSVQITRRFMQEQAKSSDPKIAAVDAIEHTIVPATLSIVTDMVGFFTLYFVDISFYQAYAIFGVFGMATLILTTTTLIPLLLTAIPMKKVEEHGGHDWEHTMGNGIAKLISGPGKWIPIGVIVCVIAISTYYTGITSPKEGDLMPGVEKGINYSRAAFKEYSITIQDIEKLNKIMPGVISVTIPIRGRAPLKPECLFEEGEDPNTCHDPDEQGAQGVFNNADVMADVAKLEEWMRAHPFIGYTGSYAQYMRLVHMLLETEPGEQPDRQFFFVPNDENLQKLNPDDDRPGDEIVQLYNGLLEAMTNPGELDSFVTPDFNEGVVMGFINTMDPVETHQAVVDIQNYIEEHKNDKGFKQVHFGLRCGPVEDLSCDTNELSIDGPNYEKPAVGGFLGATEATRDVAYEQWLKSPLTTILAITVISALIFRSFTIALMLFGILLVTLYAQYGLGGYMTTIKNWSGNLAFHTQVALSISMGLGVDYAIYMISRIREEMAATGCNWDESLKNTLAGTGSAVIVSVIVLLGSFIPLLNTELANTWALGVYISMALILDVFLALMILPKITRPNYICKPTE
ncbi:MAG: transporter [Gammaproteobacteria bacterium]|nr:MAG: transporter [Gammaproteobacteria bacterium]